MRFFRRGAHHQTGFRPTVDDLAAAIKRQAHRPIWTTEIICGREVMVWHGTAHWYGTSSGSVVFTVAPEGGIATIPAMVPYRPGELDITVSTHESEATA